MFSAQYGGIQHSSLYPTNMLLIFFLNANQHSQAAIHLASLRRGDAQRHYRDWGHTVVNYSLHAPAPLHVLVRCRGGFISLMQTINKAHVLSFRPKRRLRGATSRSPRSVVGRLHDRPRGTPVGLAGAENESEESLMNPLVARGRLSAWPFGPLSTAAAEEAGAAALGCACTTAAEAGAHFFKAVASASRFSGLNSTSDMPTSRHLSPYSCSVTSQCC